MKNTILKLPENTKGSFSEPKIMKALIKAGAGTVGEGKGKVEKRPGKRNRLPTWEVRKKKKAAATAATATAAAAAAPVA